MSQLDMFERLRGERLNPQVNWQKRVIALEEGMSAQHERLLRLEVRLRELEQACDDEA